MSLEIKMEEYFPLQRETQPAWILRPVLAAMGDKNFLHEELIKLQANLGVKAITTAFLSQSFGVASWMFLQD